jgi:hypothetical protein
LVALIALGIFALVIYEPVFEAYKKRNEKKVVLTTATSSAPTSTPVSTTTPPPSRPEAQASPIWSPKTKQLAKHQSQGWALAALEAPTAATPQQPQQQSISAPNGIAIGGGTVTNPTVNNFAPPARTLTKDQHDKIVSALAGKQLIVKFGYLIDAPDARQFASKLCAAVKDAIPATNCSDIWAMVIEGPSKTEGFTITYKGDAVPTGTRTSLAPDTPAGAMINALVAAGMNRGTVHADPTMRDGELLVVVGTAPTQ